MPSSSSSPPASTRPARDRRVVGAAGRSRPSTTARSAPGRTRAASARPPNSSSSAVTTIVLPAPVSPVSTVRPGRVGSTASSMTPRSADPQLVQHGRRLIGGPSRRRLRSTATSWPTAPVVSPVAGRRIEPVAAVAQATHRQLELGDQPVGERVHGQPGHRHRRGAAAHPTRAPGGTSTDRRPSQLQHRRVRPAQQLDLDAPSRAPRRAAGRTGRGRRSAPRSSASTSGQTTGPPAEKAYAVEPVGVAHSTPSQPNRRQRPAVDRDRDLEHPLPVASSPREASFSAQVRARRLAVDPDLGVERSCAPRPCSGRSTIGVARRRRSSSGSASARKPTWPRLTPSSGTPAGRASSAARRNVPSPPSTSTISHPRRPSAVDGATVGACRPASAASSAQHPHLEAGVRAASADGPRASATIRPRPVCATTSTGRASHVGPALRRSDPHGSRRTVRDRGARRRASAPSAGSRRKPQEEFHVARRTRQRARLDRRAPPAEPAAAARRPARPRRPAAPGHAPRRRAEPLPADLELRLDHQHQIAAGRGAGGSAGSTSGSEMNDRSATISSTGPPIWSGVRRARWSDRGRRPARRSAAARPAARNRRRPRRPAPRPGPQQHVGEPTGGRARVEAAPPRDHDAGWPHLLERRQRAVELDRAPRDPIDLARPGVVGAGHRHRGRGLDGLGRPRRRRRTDD